MKINKFITIPCNECGKPKKVINGHYLKYIRIRHNIDQRKFGSKINVSSPYISDIERNRRECPLDILEAYFKLEGNKK